MFLSLRSARADDPLRIGSSGVGGCEADALFNGPAYTETTTTPVSPAEVRTVVPNLAPGSYRVSLRVQGVTSPDNEHNKLTIEGFRRLSVDCDLAQLAVAPASPSRTRCAALLEPLAHGVPEGLQLLWASSNSDVVDVDFGGISDRDLIQDAVAVRPGTAIISATLSTVLGIPVLSSADNASITVVDRTAPTVSLTSSSPATVPPGASIVATVRAEDNVEVARVRLRAVGEAVIEGDSNHIYEQDRACLSHEKICLAPFTVNLKSTGFTDRQVTLIAEAVDSEGNTGVAPPLTFTIGGQDTACPVVTIQSPVAGAIVRAGDAVQVVALATDNRPGDTGVKRFVYSASGDALVAPVSGELPFPSPLPEPTLRFASTVKSAAQLAGVSNKTITIAVEAIDRKVIACRTA